jgi:hypothetical protein
MLIKQARLIILWLYYLSYIAITAAVYITIPDPTDEIGAQQKYIMCVLLNGNASKCRLESPGASFTKFLFVRVITIGFPTLVFCVFGARPSLFRFWKEYFIASFKNRRLYLEFIPSFDPTFESSQSTRIQDTIPEEECSIDTQSRQDRRGRKLNKVIQGM